MTFALQLDRNYMATPVTVSLGLGVVRYPNCLHAACRTTTTRNCRQ